MYCEGCYFNMLMLGDKCNIERSDIRKIRLKIVAKTHPDKWNNCLATIITQMVNKSCEILLKLYDGEGIEEGEMNHNCEEMKFLEIEMIKRMNGEEEREEEMEEEMEKEKEKEKEKDKEEKKKKKKEKVLEKLSKNQVKRYNRKPWESMINKPEGKELEKIVNHENHNKVLLFEFKWKNCRETTTGRIELAMEFKQELKEYLLSIKGGRKYKFLLRTYSELLDILE